MALVKTTLRTRAGETDAYLFASDQQARKILFSNDNKTFREYLKMDTPGKFKTGVK